jgi:DNA polymerase III epsilon subunit-like protein
MPVKYFAFDVETTGFYPFAGDEILSIAFMLLDDDLYCVKKGQWFVNPSEGCYVDPEAAELNGYSPALWADRGAVSQEQLKEKLMFLWETHDMQRALPLGQNISFDVNFLDALAHKDEEFAKAYKRAIGYHKLDIIALGVTLDQAHRVTKAFYRLADLCERWGVTLTNAHDSLADLEATVACFAKYLEHFRGSPKPPTPPPSRFLEKLGGTYRFRVGKHQRTPLESAPVGYLQWMLGLPDLHPEERVIVAKALGRELG